MPFSKKQQEFFMNATHRWNIKTGATRSGKTYMDYFVIPKRIRNCTGHGLICIIGNNRGTIVRNILEPMRTIWGDQFVGVPKSSSNSVRLFGKTVFLFGADNKASVKKLQGAGIEYCYGDEITTWNEDLFAMLKTRLDKPNSIFDGTCNPDNPGHWFKKFLDSDADIYSQSYTIDDNPALAEETVKSLKRELAGTVYYDRFILGKWVAAQGVIYQQYAADPSAYDMISANVDQTDLMAVNIGVDFGGTKSGTAFVATGITSGYGSVIGLLSRRVTATLDPPHLNRAFVDFVIEVVDTFGRADAAYCDNAEPILIRGLKNAAIDASLPCVVREAAKTSINGRIRLTSGLISQNRLRICEGCETLRKALSEALWNGKSQIDERLDDGTTDVDTLDAFEYSIERDRNRLMGATLTS